MQETVAPSRDGSGPFTLREAAAVLGISLNTLRRRIAAGQVQAEQVQRPQGFVWQVHLHGAATQRHRADETVQQDGAGTVQQPSTAIMQAEAMAAYTRSLLEPLVNALERSEGRVAELERENGRLVAERDGARAELDALRAAEASRAAQPEPEAVAPAPTTSGGPVALLRRFWPLLVAVVVLVATGAWGWLG